MIVLQLLLGRAAELTLIRANRSKELIMRDDAYVFKHQKVYV